MTDELTLPTHAELTRPIIGIENRTAQEVFDIMCDRITAARAGLAVAEDMRERAALPDDPKTILIAYEEGDHMRLSRALTAAQARITELEDGVKNAKGFLDNPLSRRRHAGDQFYTEVVASLRALSPVKENDRG